MNHSGLLERASKLGWLSLVILSVACALAIIGSAIFALLVEPIQRDLIITPLQLSGQLTLIYIIQTNIIGFDLGPVLVGTIIDHIFGRLGVVTWSVVNVASLALLTWAVRLWIIRRRLPVQLLPATAHSSPTH